MTRHALAKIRARVRHRVVRHWREVGSAVGEAETRMRLAECLLQDQDSSGSELERHVLESNLAPVAAVHRVRLAALHDALRGLRGVVSG
jgi:hypothetical protein